MIIETKKIRKEAVLVVNVLLNGLIDFIDPYTMDKTLIDRFGINFQPGGEQVFHLSYGVKTEFRGHFTWL